MIRALIVLSIMTILIPSSGWAQNNPPVLDPIRDTSITEGDTLVMIVTASDPDGMPPGLSAAYMPDNASFQDNGGGNGTFVFIPGFAQAGIYDVWFYAFDAEATDSASARITVLEAGNQPPVLEPIGARSILEGATLEIDVQASDPDGSMPALSTSLPLPANASFIDNGDATGTFTFTPDETQYGSGSADTSVTFYAFDGSETDSEEVTITVTGPNETPIITPIGSQQVIEGNTLALTVEATDPNGTIPVLSATGLPDNAFFVDRNNGTGDFAFIPSFVQAGEYAVIFIAFDGKSADSLPVDITVLEASNQAPVFNSIGQQTVIEGDLLTFQVSAVDPEGEAVFLTMLDTIPNSSFNDASGEFSFTPSLTQGGDYLVDFKASDSTEGATQFATSTMTVSIKVEELDHPPVLDQIGGKSIREGRPLVVFVSGSDQEETNPRFSVSPVAADPRFGGGAGFYDPGQGTAVFEFRPEFTQLESGSELMTLTFFARDSVDVDSEQVVVTVYDVSADLNDPGQPDTLTLDDIYWNGDSTGFSVTGRIVNDSAIGAAGTGFKWSEDWIRCDSVRIHLPLTDTDYKTVFINNDSLMLFVGFIFFDSTFLFPGAYQYFTAYFSYDPALVDIDSAWTGGSRLFIDSTAVGNNGIFGFDYRIRTGPQKISFDNQLPIIAEGTSTYKPLIFFPFIRPVINQVEFEIYDIAENRCLRPGDTMYASGSNREYQVRINIGNAVSLGGVNLGFSIFSPDGATWTYVSQPDGLGPLTGSVTVIADSRMDPHEQIWAESGGLDVLENDVNGYDTDSILCFGSAGTGASGMPAGIPQDMITLNFIPGGVTGEEVKTIGFDSVWSGQGGLWGFYDTLGNHVRPYFTGILSYPVKESPSAAVHDDDTRLPDDYTLEQNYPNPFNPATTIGFSVPRTSWVRLTVFNILGQSIKVLADAEYPSGRHQLVWDGGDRSGKDVASGIYFYLLETKEFRAAKKMVLVR